MGLVEHYSLLIILCSCVRSCVCSFTPKVEAAGAQGGGGGVKGYTCVFLFRGMLFDYDSRCTDSA